jgi:hypothetical protein
VGAGIALNQEYAQSNVVPRIKLVLMEVSKDAKLMSWAKLCGMAYALVMNWLPFLTGIHEHQI